MTVTRDANDPHWVQGQVRVAAPPDAVWAQLHHVESWPQLFTDIEKLRVLACDTSGCNIELETRTLGHGSLPYRVEFQQGRRMKVWTHGQGVRAVTYTLVREGQTPTESNVAYSMYIDLSGLPSVLISEKSLREKQDHMVAVTLEDMSRNFARP